MKFILSFLIFCSCATPASKQTALSRDRLELPEITSKDHVVFRTAYSLSFDESHNIARWVAYSLTREHQSEKEVSRANNYSQDPDFPSADASHTYYGSGYDRGHLAPAEDFRWSEKAERESFYGANFAPQTSHFNSGIWKKLENKERAWATRDAKVFIVDGPIIEEGLPVIDPQHVIIPKKFYKVFLEYSPEHKRAIGFVIPQDYQSKDLCDYAESLAQVESEVKIHFFASIPAEDQKQIETQNNCTEWMEK